MEKRKKDFMQVAREVVEKATGENLLNQESESQAPAKKAKAPKKKKGK